MAHATYPHTPQKKAITRADIEAFLGSQPEDFSEKYRIDETQVNFLLNAIKLLEEISHKNSSDCMLLGKCHTKLFWASFSSYLLREDRQAYFHRAIQCFHAAGKPMSLCKELIPQEDDLSELLLKYIRYSIAFADVPLLRRMGMQYYTKAECNFISDTQSTLGKIPDAKQTAEDKKILAQCHLGQSPEEARQREEKNTFLREGKEYLVQRNFLKAAEMFRQAAIHEVVYVEYKYVTSRDDSYGSDYTEIHASRYLRDSIPDYSCVFEEIQSYLAGNLHEDVISRSKEYLKHWDIKKKNIGDSVFSIAAELHYLCGLAYLKKGDRSKALDSFGKSYQLSITALKNNDFDIFWRTNNFIFSLLKNLPFEYSMWEKLWKETVNAKNSKSNAEALACVLSEKFYQVSPDEQKNILAIYEKLIKPHYSVHVLDVALQDQICESVIFRKAATWQQYPQNIYAAICLYEDAKAGHDKLKHRDGVLQLCSNVEDVMHYARLQNRAVRAFFEQMVELQHKDKNQNILSNEITAQVACCLSLFCGEKSAVMKLMSDAIAASPDQSATFFIRFAFMEGCSEQFVDSGLHTFLATPPVLDAFFRELAKCAHENPRNGKLLRLCQKVWEIVSKSGCHDFIKARADVEVVRQYQSGITITKDIEEITVVIDRLPALLGFFNRSHPRASQEENQRRVDQRDREVMGHEPRVLRRSVSATCVMGSKK